MKRLLVILPAVSMLAACGSKTTSGANGQNGADPSTTSGLYVESKAQPTLSHGLPLSNDLCLTARKNHENPSPVLSVGWTGEVHFYTKGKPTRKISDIRNGRLYLASKNNPDFPKGWSLGDGATVGFPKDGLHIEWAGQDDVAHQTTEMSLDYRRVSQNKAEAFLSEQDACVRGIIPGRLNSVELQHGSLSAGNPLNQKVSFSPEKNSAVSCKLSADKKSIVITAQRAPKADPVAPAPATSDAVSPDALSDAVELVDAPPAPAPGTAPAPAPAPAPATPTPTPSPKVPQGFALTISASDALSGAPEGVTLGSSLTLGVTNNPDDTFKGDCLFKAKKTADVLDGSIECKGLEYFSKGTDSHQAVPVTVTFACDGGFLGQ